MIHENYSRLSKPVSFLWRVYFALAAIQAGVMLALVLATGADGMRSLSPFRMGLAFAAAALFLSFCWLALESWLRPERLQRRWLPLVQRLEKPKFWSALYLLSVAAAAAGLYFFALTPDLAATDIAALAARLQPPALLIGGLGLQTAATLLALRHGPELGALRPKGRLFYTVVLLMVGGLLLWSVLAVRVIPDEAQRIGWNELGAPITGLQLLVAWLAAALWMGASDPTGSPKAGLRQGLSRLHFRRAEVWLSVLIWLAAVITWQTSPTVPNWFLSEPVYPNFENYPNSDARAYDSAAQTALIGEGYIVYDMPYIRRSLLAMFMTGLHLLGGQDYERVVFFQIMVLALIPVMAYHLGRSLHNRYTGLLLAVLIIFREANAIRLAGDITTSNAKLLMADLPAAAMTLAFCLAVVRWLDHIENRRLALLCGGVLGLSMLIRPEAFVFFLPVAVIAGIILWRPSRHGLWLHSGLLAALGLLLALAPWVYRNYARTGELFLDHPSFQVGLFLQRFHPDRDALKVNRTGDENPLDALPTLPAEGTTAVTPAAPEPTAAAGAAPAAAIPPASTAPVTPAATDPRAELIARETARALDYIRQNAGRLFGVMTAHFLNSNLQSVLILPTTYRGFDAGLGFIAHRSVDKWVDTCCSTRDYVQQLPFWRSWDGRFPLRTALPLTGNLVLIAYGIHTAWKSRRWAGVIPIWLAVFYYGFNGLLRNSGGRYILPVDWTAPLYFSIGLIQLTRNLAYYLRDRAAPAGAATTLERPLERLEKFEQPERIAANAAPRRAQKSVGRRFDRGAVGIILVIFLLGALPPLVERSFPQRYTPAKIENMSQLLLNAEQLRDSQRNDLHQFLANGATVLAGRALYPRYFPPGVGDPVARRSPFAARPYPRLAFYLAGSRTQTLALPVEGKPEAFPNAVDVLVILCPERELLALGLYRLDGALDRVYLRAPFPDQPVCPVPALGAEVQ